MYVEGSEYARERTEGCVNMENKIKGFLKSRNVDEYIKNNIGYICQSGSYITGTNNEDSDLDFRGIVLPDEDHILGLKQFTHLKLAEGEKNINLSGDMDLELFSLRAFVDQLYKGHVTPIEMLFLEDRFIYLMDDRLKIIRDNKDLFLSKSVVFHYLSMNKQFEKRIDIPVGNIRNPLSVDRIVKYGYETKNASKAIMYLRIMNHFLKSGELVFYRDDKDELKSIKEGNISLDKIINEINYLRLETESLLEDSLLPKVPDFTEVNGLYKDLIKQYI